MIKSISLETPLSSAETEKLRVGDRILLNGVIYTGRDTAHKRLFELAMQGKDLPFNISGQVIYYAGPTPPKPGQAIGSAGPTTSYRMDAFTPRLIELGLKGMIGKGQRSEQVIEAIKKFKAVYFGATGGAGALIAKSIIKAEVAAYEDLGPEAILKLEVKNFPLIVINDTIGNDLYIEGIKKFTKL
ncbi:MAG: Fe-S-containing hydro-lyase [Spirochaetota bacterium]